MPTLQLLNTELRVYSIWHISLVDTSLKNHLQNIKSIHQRALREQK